MDAWMRLVLPISFLCLLWWPAAAEPVMIDQIGQGLTFSHRGNCYVMLPQHVLGPPGRIKRTLSAQTSMPRVTGGGTVVYETGIDLVLAHLTGEIKARCELQWRELPRDLSELLRASTVGELVWVSSSGSLERTELRIDAVEFDRFYATPRDPMEMADGFKGQSGSIFFIGDVPVGMAVEVPEGGEITFLRMDAMVDQVDRFLRQGTPPRPPVSAAGEVFAFELIAWSPEAQGSALNALTGEPGRNARYRASLSNGPVILEIAFPGEEPVAVERLTLTGGDPGGGAVPRAIRVEVDSTSGSRYRWRVFATGDMAPDGKFEAIRGGGTWARRMRIRIDSAWDNDDEIALGPIKIE